MTFLGKIIFAFVLSWSLCNAYLIKRPYIDSDYNYPDKRYAACCGNDRNLTIEADAIIVSTIFLKWSFCDRDATQAMQMHSLVISQRLITKHDRMAIDPDEPWQYTTPICRLVEGTVCEMKKVGNSFCWQDRVPAYVGMGREGSNKFHDAIIRRENISIAIHDANGHLLHRLIEQPVTF